MKRRTFIQNSGLVASAAFLPKTTLTSKTKGKYKLGYQLYSIRDEMAKDPVSTVQSLQEMGYEDFEVYGYDADSKRIYGMKAREFRNILDDIGASISSGHYLLAGLMDANEDAMAKTIDSCVECAIALNSKYITWPFMPPELRTLENYKKLPKLLNKIGQRVQAAGLGFAYHNHGFEFEEYDGQTAFDMIVENTDPNLVKLQMDMYWVMHAAKTTPKELVSKHPGRFVMWHVKDMDAVTRDYSELGQGAINYLNVLPDTEESGLEFSYIEQGGNFKVNSMESARTSADYYKKHLRDLI